MAATTSAATAWASSPRSPASTSAPCTRKNSDTDAQAYELFVNKEVFKNTYFYAEYGSVDETTATSIKGDGFAIGMIFTF